MLSLSLSLCSDVDQSVRAWAQHSSDKAAQARMDLAQQLLGGAPLDEEDGNGMAALMWGSFVGDTDVEKVLLPTVVAFDEGELGRMAATLFHRHLLQRQGSPTLAMKAVAMATPEAAAAAKTVLQLVRLSGLARGRANLLRSSDSRSADDPQTLFTRLQLAAAACVQSDEFGETSQTSRVQELLSSDDGRKARS